MRECKKCNGTGKIDYILFKGGNSFKWECNICEGTGEIDGCCGECKDTKKCGYSGKNDDCFAEVVI